MTHSASVVISSKGNFEIFQESYAFLCIIFFSFRDLLLQLV
jgi:hypothetical protein